MNADIVKIRKILLISLAALAACAIACFFLLDRLQFYSILASGLLTYVFFAATLLFYYLALKNRGSKTGAYIFLVFFIKLLLSALSFYIVYRFDYLNTLSYIFSFLVFFTIFFNLEIFLIYKKFLFSKK